MDGVNASFQSEKERRELAEKIEPALINLFKD